MGAASGEDLLAVINRQGYTARVTLSSPIGEPTVFTSCAHRLLERSGFSCQVKPAGRMKCAVRLTHGSRFCKK